MLNPKNIFDEFPTKMKSIAGSRSPFRAHGEHSAECLPHGQPRRRDLGQVPRMDGPR